MDQQLIPWSLPTKADVIPPLSLPDNSNQRNRCSYILIDRTVNSIQSHSIKGQIDKLKTGVIQQMKLIVKMAHDGDIIQINTCDTKLAQPPLIPFCQTTQVDNEENCRRIENLKFEKCSENNLFICIAAAYNEIARQMTCYTDLFVFKVNSVDFSKDGPVERSVTRLVKGCQTIKTQIFDFSEQTNCEKEHFQRLGISQVQSLSNQTVNHSYDHHHNGNRKEIVIDCKQNDRSSKVHRSQTISHSHSYAHVPPVTTHTKIRYTLDDTSTIQSSQSSPNHYSTPQNRPAIFQGPSMQATQSGNSPSQQRYRFPRPNPKSSRFTFGFG